MISAFRKTSVFFLLIAIFLSFLHSGQQKDQIISLPVVIHGSNSGSPGALVLEDFELFVNGEKRDVISFRKKDRNLGWNSDLARDFILSFGFSELDEHLKRALSYFLTEVLRSSDTLSIVTPGKVFRVRVNVNKEGMVDTLNTLLEKECKDYRKRKQVFSKSLRNGLRKILDVLADTSDRSSIFQVRRYKKIIGFLNSFPVEFNNFLKYSIVLNLHKFENAISDIRYRSGEKWWFHFHRRESGKLFSRIARVIKDIEEYSSYSENIFDQNLSPLMKRLRRLLYSTDFFPSKEIRERMLKWGIGFHSVIYTSSGDKGNLLSGNESSVYDMIFDDISGYTGGDSFYSVDPEGGIRRMTNNTFVHYNVDFSYNGEIEEKKIVLRSKKIKLSDLKYPSRISQDDLKQIIANISLKKCSIEKLKLTEDIISFWIKGYKFLPEQNAGLLRVRLEVFSKDGNLIYQKENTLRSPVKDLNLKIPFPVKRSGDLKIRIIVIDLVDNYKTMDSILISL